MDRHGDRNEKITLVPDKGSYPFAFAAQHDTYPVGQHAIVNPIRILDTQPDKPKSLVLKAIDSAPEISRLIDLQVMNGTGGSLNNSRRHPYRTVPGYDDVLDSHRLGRSQKGPEVVRVSQSIQDQDLFRPG